MNSMRFYDPNQRGQRKIKRRFDLKRRLNLGLTNEDYYLPATVTPLTRI